MKSRMSFCNRASFRKDITRFAPLWALYTAAIALIMVTGVAEIFSYEHPVEILDGRIQAMAVPNFIYGMLAAQLLFGDLFQSRMCNALHAMPIRRETWFGSHILSGLSFSILPNLLVSLVMMPFLRGYWYVSLLWLAGATLQYLFFFGVGTLSIFCTGNRFASAVVYMMVNFLAIVALWFLETVYVPMLPSVILNDDAFLNFCPVAQMAKRHFMDVDWHFTNGEASKWTAGLIIEQEGWVYSGICAVIGVGAAAVSLLLYRRRSLECAGDFMAVKALRPEFLVLYTLCAGAFLSAFGELFLGSYRQAFRMVFLVVGLTAGFFTGRMLLERTSKVFNKKSFLQLAVLTAVILASVGLTELDVLGVVSYVPETEMIDYVEVSHPKEGVYRMEYSDTENNDTVRRAHRMAIEQGENPPGQGFTFFRVAYHLKDGREVCREYDIEEYGQIDSLLNTLPIYSINVNE